MVSHPHPHPLMLTLTTTVLLLCGSGALSPLRHNSFKQQLLVPSSSHTSKFGLSNQILCIRDRNDDTCTKTISRGSLLMAAAAAKGTSRNQGDDMEGNRNDAKIGDINNLQSFLPLEDANNDFHQLIQAAIQTLVRSDVDGEELDHSYGSASQGLWMHAPTAKTMQQLLNRLALKVRCYIESVGNYALQEALITISGTRRCLAIPRWILLLPSNKRQMVSG
jgi:hypothetical protein